MNATKKTLSQMLDELMDRCRKLTDNETLAGLEVLGGGMIADEDKRLVRGNLIQVWCERHSGRYTDGRARNVGSSPPRNQPGRHLQPLRRDNERWQRYRQQRQ
jgi:hypothetical protein